MPLVVKYSNHDDLGHKTRKNSLQANAAEKNLYHHPQFQFMSALLDALGLLAASKRTFIRFSTEHDCQSTRLTNVMTHWTKY